MLLINGSHELRSEEYCYHRIIKRGFCFTALINDSHFNVTGNTSKVRCTHSPWVRHFGSTLTPLYSTYSHLWLLMVHINPYVSPCVRVMHIYIYMHVGVCVCVCVYQHVCWFTQRRWENELEKVRKQVRALRLRSGETKRGNIINSRYHRTHSEHTVQLSKRFRWRRDFAKCTHLYETGQNGKGDRLIVWRHFLKRVTLIQRSIMEYQYFIYCSCYTTFLYSVTCVHGNMPTLLQKVFS